MTDENRIRERAYAIWQSDGEPEDKADEIWLRAERELKHDDDANGTEAVDSTPAQITPPLAF